LAIKEQSYRVKLRHTREANLEGLPGKNQTNRRETKKKEEKRERRWRRREVEELGNYENFWGGASLRKESITGTGHAPNRKRAGFIPSRKEEEPSM